MYTIEIWTFILLLLLLLLSVEFTSVVIKFSDAENSSSSKLTTDSSLSDEQNLSYYSSNDLYQHTSYKTCSIIQIITTVYKK